MSLSSSPTLPSSHNNCNSCMMNNDDTPDNLTYNTKSICNPTSTFATNTTPINAGNKTDYSSDATPPSRIECPYKSTNGLRTIVSQLSFHSTENDNDDEECRVSPLSTTKSTIMSPQMRQPPSERIESSEYFSLLSKSKTSTTSVAPSSLGPGQHSKSANEFNSTTLVSTDGGEVKLSSKMRNYLLSSSFDKDSTHFAIRMSVLLTFSSLFVLIRTPTWQYPDAMWILISVLFVCWFPSLDAASVIEKIIQRMIGTIVGAVAGIVCGFVSIWICHGPIHPVLTQQILGTYHSITLSTMLFAGIFAIIFFASQFKVGGVLVIHRFSYATILCVLTYCLCLLSFNIADHDEPRWKHGVFRIINVFIGCVVGAIGSVTIYSKPTSNMLFEKVAKQVRLAGEASEAVLKTTSDYYGGRLHCVTRLSDTILSQPLESSIRWKFRGSSSTASDDDSSCLPAEVAMKKYEDAIIDWRATKALFPLVKYDPFTQVSNLSSHNDKSMVKKAKKLQSAMAHTLARALRIQTTIVVLDGMIRNDAEYVFTAQHLILFSEIGRLIRRMLTVPLNFCASNDAAAQLFERLEDVRSNIQQVAGVVAAHAASNRVHEENGLERSCDDSRRASIVRETSLKRLQQRVLTDVCDDSKIHPLLHYLNCDDEDDDEDEEGRGIPKNVTSKHDNTLFFLNLVEHLILRSLRLYQAWKHVEIKSGELH